MVVKIVVKVAAAEVGHGLSKGADVGVARGDGRGNLAAREEPNLNVVRSPLHGIDTPTDLVEAGASGSSSGIEECTTSAIAGGLKLLVYIYLKVSFITYRAISTLNSAILGRT